MRSEFVGREPDLQVLSICADRAIAGRAQLVVVDGSPGIGKTSLMGQFVISLSGWRVITVSSDESESRLPHALVRHLSLAASLGSSGAETDADADADKRASVDPMSVGADVLKIIGGLQERGPLAVILEDAAWADPQSLAALTFALRRLHAEQVITVVTSRTDDMHRLPEGLRRHAHDHGTMMTLQGLDAHSVKALCSRMGHLNLSNRAAERLRKHTDGNPLHLCALLTELSSAELQHSLTLPAPEHYSRLVLASMAGCTEQARSLLTAAAVLGMECPLESAAIVAAVAQPLEALEQAVKTGIIRSRRTTDGWTLTFRHSLTRAAVYEDLGPATRAQLHHRAADLGAAPSQLAHRVAAAYGPTPELLPLLEAQAQDDIRQGRLALAADWLLSAAKLSGPGDEDQFVLAAVELLLQAGEVTEAASFADGLLARVDTPQRRLIQARLAWGAGRYTDVERLAQEVWSSGSDHEAAAAASMLTHLRVLQNDNASAARWADRALAGGVQPEPIGSDLRALRALATCLSGRGLEGLQMLRDLPRSPKEVPAGRLGELLSRGEMRLFANQLQEALADLQEFLPGQRGFGVSTTGLSAISYLAEAEYRLGAWDDSLAHAELALSLVVDSGQTWLLAFAHAIPVLVLAGRGQWTEAQAHAEHAQAAATRLGDLASRGYAANAAVHLAACRGDGPGVVAAVQPLLDFGVGTTTYEPGVLAWRGQYAEALVALGRYDDAATILNDLSAMAAQRSLSSTIATVARIQGQLDVALGDLPAARASFERAINQTSGTALEQALSRLAFGSFLRRRGERRHAQNLLKGGNDALVALRAEPFIARWHSELLACGASDDTTNGLTPSIISELTPQERAVAHLIATGQTNREAAVQLVLSVKTVAYHLGHVYAKLGVRSRSELAALLSKSNGSGP